MKKQIEALQKKLDVRSKALAKERDRLRDVADEATELAQCATDGIESIEDAKASLSIALDALSRLV